MRIGEMKVYSGASMVNGKQVAVIVAATSQRTAVAALENFGIVISVRHLITYWTVTGNRKACEVALAQPGLAFAATSLDSDDYAPLPQRIPAPRQLGEPKVPKDRDGRRTYDREKRGESDTAKRERGERRLTCWIPKEAAEALDKMTNGSAERGAVRDALTLALVAYANQQKPQAKRKAA